MADTYREFDKSDTAPIIPEIRIKSYRFRVRELILATLSVVACMTCLILVVVVAKKGSSSNMSGTSSAQFALKTLCTTPPCLKVAAYAVANMNASVKPCDNFFQYACGNFPLLNPLDPDTSRRTVFWNLLYENEDKLRTILEQSAKRTASFSSERKLKDFFVSCIDDYGKMNAGGRVFIEKIVQPLGGWDVLGTFDASAFDFQTSLEKASIDYWVAAFFTFRVVTDPYNRQRRVIEIDYSGMGMYWPYYIRSTTEQMRTGYKKFIRTVGQFLARDSGMNLDPDQLKNRTETFVNDAYDVEFQLANITANTVPTRNPHSPEKKITLQNLTDVTNNVVNFVHFFQRLFDNTVQGNTKITLREHDWLQRVLVMIKNIPADIKARKLSNYLIWRLARRYAQELSWEYIHANRKFYDEVYGFTNFWGTWYHCLWHMDHSMPEALGSLYAKKHFNDKNKEKAQEIVRYVKTSLINSVDKVEFLDEETKRKAKAKLNASTDKIGYPDVYLDESAIDTIYENIQINRSDYLQNLLNLNEFDKADWKKRLSQAEDRSIWPFNAYYTTMYFYNRWNQLLIPAGMLQFPVYEWTLPHYYNFGAIGGLIGHYFVHAIDQWGSNYNQSGVYGQWYSNTSKHGYQKAKDCYASAFQNKTMGPYKLPGQSTPVTVPVRGSRFAWEGMAETSGIRAAYNAYKNWISDNQAEQLTPTPHYTNDQTFFLTYAQLNCFVRTDQQAYYNAQRNRVSEDIRVNTAFSLLNEFTTAFGCPADSPMNAPKKCETF